MSSEEDEFLLLLREVAKRVGNSGISNITGLIQEGSNITITGSGTALDPYVINSTASGGASITVVANYSALPDPTTVSGQFYWVSNTQGTKWLPGSLGGTFYNKGIYYSNGISWEFIDTPYQATQSTVDTGTNTDQFVTPATLNNYSGWNKTKVGLGNVTNDLQLKASDLDTDGTLAANSDSKIASQKAVKTYVDSAITTPDELDFALIGSFRAIYNY